MPKRNKKQKKSLKQHVNNSKEAKPLKKFNTKKVAILQMNLKNEYLKNQTLQDFNSCIVL